MNLVVPELSGHMYANFSWTQVYALVKVVSKLRTSEKWVKAI
jgi:hypothetical protein